MKTVWIVNQYASTPEFGMGGRSFYFAKELAKLGYRVFLIASSSSHLLRGQPSADVKFDFQEQDGFTFVWVKMPHYDTAHSKQRVLNWFLFSWRIQKLYRLIGKKPDVILCSSPSPIAFLGAQRLAKKYQARLVFEVRDIWPLTLTEVGGYSARHPFIRFMQWVEDKAYRESDHVISNLKYAINHMVTRGLDKSRFTWISNGFSIEEAKNPQPLDCNVLSTLPAAKFMVGYTGTLGLANDLFTLLDAAYKLKEHSDIAFVLVGGGRHKDDLMRYAKNLNLSNVFFIDAVQKSQIQSMLEKFDVLTVGAKNQQMYRFGVSPNKLFDYLVAAKPIIYAIESGDYHPIIDSGCGFEVEAENSDELAAAVLALYNSTDADRSLMGRNGYNSALSEYEYSGLCVKLADVLFKYVT